MIPFDPSRVIYFDEAAHKYTDNMGNTFTSMTTVISKYANKFDKNIAYSCERIGKKPSHEKYLKYKGKTAAQILAEWERHAIEAAHKGTIKHDYLEKCIKSANGYKNVKDSYIQGRIPTVADIVKNPTYGQVDLDLFVKTGIRERYPVIYEILSQFVARGWKIYAEIGVYSSEHLISGLIDILLVRGTDCIVFDWKTNKADIRFEAGYYDKDIDGNLTDKFVYTNKTFAYPLNMLPDSTGHKYALQLNGYAYMAGLAGLTNRGFLIFQIRETDNGVDRVDLVQIPNLQSDVTVMFDHFKASRENLSTQVKLFI